MEALTPVPAADGKAVRDDEVFLRMNPAERIQHGLLVLSFVTLVATGLPLVFYEMKIFKSIFAFGRAFYFRGILHRVAAVVLIIDVLWHAGYTLLTARGRANFRAMRPGLKDARDAVQAFGYNVGLTRWLHARGRFRGFFGRHPFWIFAEPPAYGRYNFIEKFEYLSVAWGSFIMILSGFFMWKVEWSLRLFPLWMHDIFVIIHGYEAMLAFLAIIIWHMYNVHLNPEVFPMSRIWIDGKITGHELRTLHPLEYAEIVEERRAAAADRDTEARCAGVFRRGGDLVHLLSPGNAARGIDPAASGSIRLFPQLSSAPRNSALEIVRSWRPPTPFRFLQIVACSNSPRRPLASLR